MCTRVLWNTNARGVFVCRTMDWPTSTEPRLVVFPRGVERDGGRLGQERVIGEGASHRWRSRHGSVVATMFGLGAADGINERGLGAHMLFFAGCDFGERQIDRPAIHAGLWAQYLLDNAATVSEALDALDQVGLVMVEAHGARSTLHVAIEDVAGDSAIIEFVGGQEQVHHGREHTIMTNDPSYDQQLAILAEHDFTEATRETPIPGNVNPRDRFVRAAYYTQSLPEPPSRRAAVAGVMAIARNVSVPFGAPYKAAGTVYNTEYRTVADLSERRYFLELTTSPSVMWVDLDRFDLSPGRPAMELDPDRIDLSGDVSTGFGVLDPIPF